jgi:hypothetical protein
MLIDARSARLDITQIAHEVWRHLLFQSHVPPPAWRNAVRHSRAREARLAAMTQM